MARRIKVDMTGVESFVRCEEGEHIVVLKEIEEKQASTGNDMLSVVFEVTKGKSQGARLYDNFVLTDKALWKLKGFLEIMGMKADGRISLDLDKLVGRVCIAEVIHEEYNGSVKARIENFKKLESKSSKDDEDYDDDDEDFEDDDFEEDEPEEKPKKKVKKKKVEPEPEEYDEDDEDEDEDDYESMTNKELRKIIRKKGITIPSGTKKAGLLALLKDEPEDDEDDDDDEDDWDEE